MRGLQGSWQGVDAPSGCELPVQVCGDKLSGTTRWQATAILQTGSAVCNLGCGGQDGLD